MEFLFGSHLRYQYFGTPVLGAYALNLPKVSSLCALPLKAVSWIENWRRPNNWSSLAGSNGPVRNHPVFMNDTPAQHEQPNLDRVLAANKRRA